MRMVLSIVETGFFDDYMSVFCGSVVTIRGIYHTGYDIQEDMQCRTWTDEMIEGIVDAESQDNVTALAYDNLVDFDEYFRKRLEE